MTKARAKMPTVIKVRDNVPEGCEVQLSPAVMRQLISLFGEKTLAGLRAARAARAAGVAGAQGDADKA